MSGAAGATGQRRWDLLAVLNWTAQRFTREAVDSPRLDAEVLLAHCLGVERIRLYMDHDKPLSEAERAVFRELVRRRLAGEPVAYIIGTREFWSLVLEVGPAVLIPRPETEGLVEQALARLGAMGRPEPVTAVDVGTGSGAIALALASELPHAAIHATEISPAALELARSNAARLELSVQWHQGDLLERLPRQLRPDLVVSNPPYIASRDLVKLPRDVRSFEPRGALDGGADGLQVINRLVPQAAQRLGPGGALMLEIGHDQGPAVGQLLRLHGFEQVEIIKDLAGLDRIVSGIQG